MLLSVIPATQRGARGSRTHWRDKKLIKTHPSLSRIWIINSLRNALARKSNAVRSRLASPFRLYGNGPPRSLPNPVLKAELCTRTLMDAPMGRVRTTMIAIDFLDSGYTQTLHSWLTLRPYFLNAQASLLVC